MNRRTRRVLLSVAVLALVAAAARWSCRDRPEVTTGDLRVAVEGRNPWNHLRLNHDPGDFRFAFVGDRTGDARAGVFERAVERLNLLQPEFVLSVGDLIQGSGDKAALDAQWQEFEGLVAKLQMPFFYLPGNHDLGNDLMAGAWRERFGRRYYHFVYKDVLFLMLNTEDPPGSSPARLGQEQLDYCRRALDDNRDVRWTVVAMHKPLWAFPEADKTGLPELEKALAGRNYTVFAGHRHRYDRTERHGMRYYVLATTGGRSRLRGPEQGEFDHVVWVTMKKDGPVLANLMLEGIYSEDVRAARPAGPAKAGP